MKGKKIVLGVSGSVAAYKAAVLAGRLKREGADIYTVMTENAAEFIGPATFRALTGNPVLKDMFPKENPFSAPVHIGIADWMDVFVIAPATADIIGKIAHGIADCLLSTMVMAVERPVLVAPAMNEKMYMNKTVQNNIKILKTAGYTVIEPETGFLACGYTGTGRLACGDRIIEEIKKALK